VRFSFGADTTAEEVDAAAAALADAVSAVRDIVR
jgi:cysteine sulfinate desulfinase/cysteine desulfurase-like protein